MLKYNSGLKSYIDKITKYVVVSADHMLVGSFARKFKYITDVDISNNVSFVNNLSEKLQKKILELPTDIIFLYLNSGEREELIPPWKIVNEKTLLNYNHEEALSYINNLKKQKIISEEIFLEILKLMKEQSIDNLVLINEILYKDIKIRWLKEDVIEGHKFVNNKKINLQNSLDKNELNVVHYLLRYKIGNTIEYIPIDVTLKKTKVNTFTSDIKDSSFDIRAYLTYLKKEYYYIIYDVRRFFHKDKQKYENIVYLIQDKYGPYKQVIMNLFYLAQMIKYNFVNTEQIKKYADTILNKIKSLDYYNDVYITLGGDMMDEKFIKFLEYDILSYLNKELYGYAYYYISLIPKHIRPKYSFLAFDDNILDNSNV